MDYSLGNIILKNHSLIPGQAEGSNIAITGAWDMPARLGKCFHDWGNDQDSIEPYVLAEEIRFGGRNIGFTALLESPSENDALRRCYGFYEAVGGLSTLVPLITDLGTWSVYLKDKIQAEYIGDGWCKLVMTFREPVVAFTGSVPAPTNSGLGFDGISFVDLGLVIMKVTGRFDRTAGKPGSFTSYLKEGYKVTKTSAGEIGIEALITKPTYEEFNAVINQLYMLFSKPGLRYVNIENDALRKFFVKDGFTISNMILCENGETSAILNLRLTEVSSHLDWSFLEDYQGNELTDKYGQKFIITQ